MIKCHAAHAEADAFFCFSRVMSEIRGAAFRALANTFSLAVSPNIPFSHLIDRSLYQESRLVIVRYYGCGERYVADPTLFFAYSAH